MNPGNRRISFEYTLSTNHIHFNPLGLSYDAIHAGIAELAVEKVAGCRRDTVYCWLRAVSKAKGTVK